METAAKLALETGEDVDALKAAPYPGSERNVADELVHLVATIGENMTVRRVAVIDVPGGVAASYIHGALKPGLGKIGVIVGLSGNADEAIEDAGPADRHACGGDPSGCVDHRRGRFGRAGAREGRAFRPGRALPASRKRSSRRWSKAVSRNSTRMWSCWSRSGCMTARTKVKAVVEKAGAEITRFVRFHLGEGIEKETTDFAAEVAAAAGV